MSTRSKGPAAGFGWLSRGFGLTFRNPGPLFASAAVLILLGMIPSWLMYALHMGPMPFADPAHAAFDATSFGRVMALSLALSLLYVPLYAGFLRIIEARDHGRETHFLDLFQLYRDGGALRLIGYGCVMMMVYLAVVGLILLTVGHGVLGWYMQLLTDIGNHRQPAFNLPSNFGITLALLLVGFLWLFGVYAISLGQVSLHPQGVFGAIGDGMAGSLKNVLPMLVLALSALLAIVVLVIALGIVSLMAVLASKALGAWALTTFRVVMNAGTMLLLFPVMFSTMYQMWKDVCGREDTSDTEPPVAA